MVLPVLGGTLVAAGAALVGVALYTQTRRQSPASLPFVLTAGTMGVGAASLGASVLTDQPQGVLVGVAVVVCLLFPVPWLLFSLRYTGRDESVSTALVATLSTPVWLGLLSTVVILLAQFTPLLTLPAPEIAEGVTAMVVLLLTMVQWFSLLYAGGMTLVATGLLLWTFHRYDYLDGTTGTLVGTLGTVPLLAVLLSFQTVNLAPTVLPSVATVGFLVAAVTAWGVVGTGRLFDHVPAAGAVGPRTLFAELSEAVIVIDEDGTVVTVNDATRRRLADDPTGTAVDDLLGTPLASIRDGEIVAIRTETGRRLFEPTLSPLTDHRDRRVGQAIVLRDVTERTTREQRLEVLNRVLRHNLRNDMNVVLGHARRIEAEVDGGAAESAETVIDTGQRLLSFSEEAQAAERLMSEAESARATVHLERATTAAMSAAGEGTRRERDVPAVTLSAPPELLEVALENLVENAVEHNDRAAPLVRIRGSYDPERPFPLHVAVDDDGPGIPEAERNVLEAGTETALQHGSGIGLWVVRWAVTWLGGEIEFVEREPRGTSVVLRLPEAEPTDDATS